MQWPADDCDHEITVCIEYLSVDQAEEDFKTAFETYKPIYKQKLQSLTKEERKDHYGQDFCYFKFNGVEFNIEDFIREIAVNPEKDLMNAIFNEPVKREMREIDIEPEFTELNEWFQKNKIVPNDTPFKFDVRNRIKKYLE